jgi:LacI family transcriptional regulator
MFLDQSYNFGDNLCRLLICVKMKIKNETDNVGVKEIARLAKVGLATVDRVIHNRQGVSKSTRERIEKIITQLNYQPNIFARRLASRKVLEFATLIPSVSVETNFWEAPLNGIEQASMEIRQNAIQVKKYFFDLNNKESFVKQATLILKSKPDGLLLAPTFVEESLSFLKKCKELNIPYVLINSDIPDQQALCYIGPDIFQSGYLCANLISYLIGEQDRMLLVNISNSTEQYHELHRKEEGLRAYWANNEKNTLLTTINIKKTDFEAVANALNQSFNLHPDIKLVLVSNSRVWMVAKYLKERGDSHRLLIGFDYIGDNLKYLEDGIIDFLICDKPKEQGYRGIMTLYNYIVFGMPVNNTYYMPIDIISRENHKFYRN